MENTTIPDYEWNLWLEIMKEKGYDVLKYSQEIVLDFLIQRGYLKENREDMIRTLRNNTNMSTSEIMELIQNHSRIKNSLPELSLQMNQKLDKINREMNSIVPFRKVGDRLIGFVPNETKENLIDVLDGMGNHHILLGTIDRTKWSITWNPYWVINPDVNRYVVGEIRTLKENSWFDYE
jgi:uncharacterized FlaG/YvyC family protein